MRQEQSDRLAASIVEFCRFAGAHELSADLRRTITALEAAKMIDPANRQTFAFVLQAALCSSREEWDLFLQLFRGILGRIATHTKICVPQRASDHAKATHKSRKSAPQCSSINPQTRLHRETANGKAVYGASAQQRLKKVDFSEVPLDDLARWKSFLCAFCGG